MLKHCLLCRQTVGPDHCPVEVEHCPNRCEHRHIGVDTGSNDATAVVTISPTGELEGLATTEHGAISFVRLHKESRSLKPSSYFRRTNSKGCSHSRRSETDYDGEASIELKCHDCGHVWRTEMPE